MKRIFLIVLDSVGAGALPDAAAYGDAGANTLGHIIEQAHPHLPNMEAMGLGLIPGVGGPKPVKGAGVYGRAAEVSAGKDTTTGHWEIAGLRLDTPFPTYPDGFPPEVMNAFEEAIGTKTLGNYPASGTAILDELGEEHMRTGYPIVYTSADSVFQIACHEDIVPPERLYEMCRIARRILTGPHALGRVIARPFVGAGKGQFARTGRRRDFSLEPIGPTVLNALKDHGVFTMGIGKIEDIFNHRGLTQSNHAAGNEACTDAIIEYMKKEHWRGLLFANLVDTDMLYGHRNDVPGFARALEAFDRRLPEILKLLGDDGMLIITADHGCDPAYPTTDHTRERVPLLVWGLGLEEGVDLGERATFADVSATVLEALGCRQRLDGTSFYKTIALDAN